MGNVASWKQQLEERINMAFLLEEKRGTPCVLVTLEKLYEVLNSESLKQAITEYRGALANIKFHEESGNLQFAKDWKANAGKKKSSLPGWVFSAKEMVPHEWIDSKKNNRGVGAWRHQDWAVVNGLIMCDFDHLDDPRDVYEKHIKPLFEKWKILFAFITPSGKGLKVVFLAKDEIGNIEANQTEFAKDANLELDEVCKDASRLSFCTSKEDVLYLNEEIVNIENEKFIDTYRKVYFKGVSSPDMFGGNAHSMANPQSNPDSGVRGNVNTGEDKSPAGTESSELVLDFTGYTYCGIAIEDIITKLIGDKEIKEGKRHETLFQTAKMLRYVCERSDKKVEFFLQKLPWVQELDSEDHNVSRTIADAMAKPYSSYIPKTLMNALKELGYKDDEKEAQDEAKPYEIFGQEIEKLFDKFPCLPEVCYNMERVSYPAALYVGAAFLGTLMTRTWYHYWFQPYLERRLNYAVIIIGDPGCGKSFAGDLFDLICEPISVVDEVGNAAINKFKKDRRLRETSDKEKKKEALVLPENIIRIHGPRTANGVFIEDMVNAVEIVNGKPMHLHMLTFSAELDNMTQAQKGGQWIDKGPMELLAFHNERDNQQYKNIDSVSGPFNVYWNFVYTGTPIALARKINEKNFGNGLFSRLGCIPMCSDYFACAEERVMTKAEEARNNKLKEWAYILDKVQGELPLKPLMKATHDFVREIKELAKIDGNKVEAFLVNRVPYYGINISAPFIFMRHYKEWQEKRTFKCDKYDVQLCRLVMDIQMHSQRLYFGKYAEMYFDNSTRDKLAKAYNQKNTKSNDLFKSLPDEFVIEDIQKISQDMTVNAARILVSRWKNEGRLDKVSTKRGSEKWKKK